MQNFPEIEKKILKFWQKNRIFEKTLRQRKNCPIFSFYDGPPFATGSPHYGHILASTIKDVVPRYWTMKGYYVPRCWGWDCHGLPIENIVEKKLKISGKKQIEKISIGKFNKTCRKNVLIYTKEWGKMVERIGRFVNFENSYKTMDNDYIESVWWAIKQTWDKGLIYEGRKVLLYCPRCECPISDFEVAMDNSYRELTEESVIVKFKVKNAEKIIGTEDKNLFLLAWTTTPWTLPGNIALAISKELDYILVKQNEEFYIIAESRKEILGEEFNVFKKYKGKDLIGIEYEPLYEIEEQKLRSENIYKVFPADFVSPEEGTGIVHIAPVHGEDDYKLGIEFNLPIIPLLDAKGNFSKNAPKFIQQKGFKESELSIKDNLSQRGLLYKKEKTTHSYPFCWRCGAALFYNAIPAWFINIQKIKKKLIQLNESIGWHPSHLKYGRFLKGIETAPDWTISRNRYWASPMPVWKCKECKHQEVIGSKKDLASQKFSKNKYFILRHGESFKNIKNIVSCWPEKFYLPLTKKGERQIKEAAKKLKKEKINFIFSSDLLRAKQTAEIIGKELGVELKFDKRLREFDEGELNGRLIEQAGKFWDPEAKLSPMEYYLKRFKIKAPEGESWTEIKERMYDFLKEIDKKYQNKSILIISHETPITMLEGALRGFSPQEIINYRMKLQIKTGECRNLKFKIWPYNEQGEIDLHRPYIDEVKFYCPKCKNEKELMERISEVIDCWMESASMPFAELHYPFENKNYFEKRFPAQFIAEYIAQTRAWFYVLHVVSAILFNKAPFENVVATGTILNEKGEKLSKSKMNFPDPWETIDKYGADTLRLYLMSSSVMRSQDLFFSEDDLKEIYQKNILLLLNIFSFYQMQSLKKFNLSLSPKKIKHVLDKWILSRLNCLIREVTDKMDNYDVVSPTREIKNFINELSLWYLRRSRDRFKKGDGQGVKIFGYVLFQLSKIMAPFTPFIADHVYKSIEGKKESVHLEDWPKVEKKLIDHKLEKKMEQVRRIVALALAERVKASIKVRQPLSELRIKNYELRKEEELLDLIKEEINIKKILFDKKIKKEVELNIKITLELKEEGIIREIIRQIQEMRKKSGLKPKDKISIWYSGEEKINKILVQNKKVILKEIRAKNFSLGKKSEEELIIQKEIKIEEMKLWIGISKNLKIF